jgi:type IV secretion system protein VirB1
MMDIQPELQTMVYECAPRVAYQTMTSLLVSNNPYHIDVIGGELTRQPKSLDEAVSTAKSLQSSGHNFSMGVAGVSLVSLSKYDIKYEDAFDVCTNLKMSASLMEECYKMVLDTVTPKYQLLNEAYSCYYSAAYKTVSVIPLSTPFFDEDTIAVIDLPESSIPAITEQKGSVMLATQYDDLGIELAPKKVVKRIKKKKVKMSTAVTLRQKQQAIVLRLQQQKGSVVHQLTSNSKSYKSAVIF